jgi:hypothetical protein
LAHSAPAPNTKKFHFYYCENPDIHPFLCFFKNILYDSTLWDFRFFYLYIFEQRCLVDVWSCSFNSFLSPHKIRLQHRLISRLWSLFCLFQTVLYFHNSLFRMKILHNQHPGWLPKSQLLCGVRRILLWKAYWSIWMWQRMNLTICGISQGASLCLEYGCKSIILCRKQRNVVCWTWYIICCVNRAMHFICPIQLL